MPDTQYKRLAAKEDVFPDAAHIKRYHPFEIRHPGWEMAQGLGCRSRLITAKAFRIG
jgi:hypothetical protein